MFGSKNFMRTGAQIDGVLIESDDDKAYTAASGSYHVRVRVTFDDGTTTEFATKLHTKESGARGIGSVVPVRYDASDRSKIDVDGAEIRRRREQGEQQRKDAFAAPSPVPAGSPETQLQAMWEMLKQMDVRGSELRRRSAPRDEVGAWVAEKEALDSRYRALKNRHPEWTPTPSA